MALIATLPKNINEYLAASPKSAGCALDNSRDRVRLAAPGAPAVRNGRNLYPAGSFACDLDAAGRRCRFCLALEPDQKRIFPAAACGAIEVQEPSPQARNGNLRFWEHAIRDDTDFERHVDYIHFNPVKHGYVTRVCDWPYSSFHRYAKDALLPADWGGDMAEIRLLPILCG